MRVWLLRHGETDANQRGVFQGHEDVELNPRGLEQAAQTAAFLSDVAFSCIFASDLKRASATAEQVARYQHVGVTLDADLREMHYGVLQGMRYADASSILVEYGAPDESVAAAYMTQGNAPPGGESVRSVRNRAVRVLRRIDSVPLSGAHDDILVVAHGGQLRILMTVMLELPVSRRGMFSFGNCGLTRLTRRPSGTVVDFHNVTPWNPTGVPP